MSLELGRYLTTARKDNSDGLLEPFFIATALSQQPFRPCLGCAWFVVVAPGVEVSCVEPVSIKAQHKQWGLCVISHVVMDSLFSPLVAAEVRRQSGGTQSRALMVQRLPH